MPKHTGALIPGFIAAQYQAAKVFPDEQIMEGALLFIDVCRFTSLTQQVSRGGHYGVEVITQILNSYFSAVNASIVENCGEIVKFAGDAVLAYFPGEQKASMAQLNHALELIRKRLQRLNNRFHTMYGIKVAFHGMSAWGDFRSLIIGDQKRHLDYILHGDALSKLFAKDIPAQDDTILNSSETQEKLIDPPRPPQRKTRITRKKENAFLPASIRDTARYRTFSAELRNVAILFVHIDITRFSEAALASGLNAAYIHIQDCVYRYEGLVNKIDYNEKGMVVLCSFGLPVAHLNDIERAVFAARAIVGYAEKGIFSIGITYSNIFCGILGSPQRYEYGVIGNGVNAAARLMMEALPDQILVEELFVNKTGLRFELKYLKEIMVKGFAEPVRIHSIEREIPVNQHSLQQLYSPRAEVAQKQDLRRIAELFKHKEQSKTVYLGGEPGTGKTFFAWRLIAQMRERKIALMALDEFNRAEQLYVLKQLWEQQTGDLLAETDAAVLRQHCQVEGFNPELLLRYFRDDEPELVSDEDRLLIQDAMFNSALLLLTALCAKIDLLIVDNLHWADRLSLKILREYHKSPQHCNLLLSARHNMYADNFDEAENIVLNNLSEEEGKQLLAHELANPTEEALRHIYRVSGGNPLLMVELCAQVHEHLAHTNRLITLADLIALERAGVLPHTIENIYINRLNLLPEETQDLLKLAAIIGKAFSLDELRILSEESIQVEVLRLLGSLDSQRVINKANITPEIIYIFSNNLMREAIYNTILRSEKQVLHKKIAEHYEQMEDGQRGVELIANHYILASHGQKALEYSMLAADKNFGTGNFEESSYYYQQALKHCEEICNRNSLILKLVDSLFFHSEVERGTGLLNELVQQSLSAEEGNKYIYLQIKARYLISALGELCDYLESWRHEMKKDHYYHLSMLYYADALHSRNREEELNTLIAELRNEVQKEDIPGLGKTAKTSKRRQNIYFLCKLESIMGQMAIDKSRYVQAKQHFKKALKLAGSIKDNMAIRIALQSLGNLARRDGDMVKAMDYLQKARQLSEKGGDRYGYMKVIMDIALIHRQQGDFAKAIQHYRQSLSMAKVMGNKVLLQNLSYNIGELYFQEANLDEARVYLGKALDLAIETGDSWAISYATDAMGDLTMALGDLDKAETLYRQNLSFQEKLGDLEGKAHSLGNLGNVANAREDYQLALKYYGQNLQLCQKVGDVDGAGRALYNSAIACWNMENLDEAKDRLLKARQCFVQAGQQMFLESTEEALNSLEKELETQG